MVHRVRRPDPAKHTTPRVRSTTTCSLSAWRRMSCCDRRRFVLVHPEVFLWILLTTIGGYSGVVDGLEKRSDDVSPWEQVLQQQSVVIQQQAAELTALRNDVNALKARADKKVSFSVRFSKDTVATANQDRFAFDVVVAKTGEGYDPQTGIFTAPYPGTYLFLLSIMAPNNDNYIQVAIVREAGMLALAFADSNNHDPYDNGFCHVTVHLAAGEKVWVRHNYGQPELNGYWFTSFSGVLVDAD